MAADERVFEVANVTMTGSEQAYEIPDRVRSISFQASGGEISIASTASGPTFKIASGATQPFVGRSVAKQSLYFNGTSGVVLRIMMMKGILD